MAAGPFAHTEDGVDIECALNKVGSEVVFVIGHPYPLLGGNMHNNVVKGLEKGLNENGFDTCRFNLRGVGKSGGRGSFSGNKEEKDVKAVIDFVSETYNDVVFIGYSFSSAVGMLTIAAQHFPKLRAFIAVSYPRSCITRLVFSKIPSDISIKLPSYWILGSKDEFTSVKTLDTLVQRFQNSETKIVEGADHFWFGKENLLFEHVFAWLKKLGLC